MKKENFINLLQRNSPKEILEFVKRHGKQPKPINPIYFFEVINSDKDNNGK